MSLCTKLKATFSRLLFCVQPPRSDKEALDPSRAPDVDGPANRSTAPTLLTLPAEIRDLIYTELGLRNNTFHIISGGVPSPPQTNRLLRPQLFRLPPQRIRHFRCNRSLCPSRVTTTCTCVHRHPEDEPSSASAPLLLVCRALHHETISILYAQNTFDVHSIYLFAGFAQAIGPHSLRAIRDLRLSWLMDSEVLTLRGVAEECVRTLREDMGERVRVTVSVCLQSLACYYQITGLWTGWWLEPLAKIRRGAAGMEVNIVLCKPWRGFAGGGVAWAAFQEEVERLVQSPWGEVAWAAFQEEIERLVPRG